MFVLFGLNKCMKHFQKQRADYILQKDFLSYKTNVVLLELEKLAHTAQMYKDAVMTTFKAENETG